MLGRGFDQTSDSLTLKNSTNWLISQSSYSDHLFCIHTIYPCQNGRHKTQTLSIKTRKIVFTFLCTSSHQQCGVTEWGNAITWIPNCFPIVDWYEVQDSRTKMKQIYHIHYDVFLFFLQIWFWIQFHDWVVPCARRRKLNY